MMLTVPKESLRKPYIGQSSTMNPWKTINGSLKGLPAEAAYAQRLPFKVSGDSYGVYWKLF